MSAATTARSRSPASSARRRSPASPASSARRRSQASPASSTPTSAATSRSPAHARSRSPARRPRGAPKRSGTMTAIVAAAKLVARSLWGLCTSHDFSFRRSDARHMQREFSLIRAQSPGLFWTYYFSSFTYSLIGAAMLLFFELPAIFRDSAPLPYEAHAALLVVQGLLSFAADVWARALRGFPRHGWYRVPRRPRLQPLALPPYVHVQYQRLPTPCRPTPCTRGRYPMRQVSRRPYARHHHDRVHFRPRARVLGRAQLAHTAQHRCRIARRARADCPLAALAAARTACRNCRLGGAAPRHPSLLQLPTALGCSQLLGPPMTAHAAFSPSQRR